MMETFTASNGIDVAWRDSDSGLRVLHTNAERCIAHVVPYPGWQVVGEANQNSSGSGFTETSETAKALREFFLHERDQQLGRWRDPKNHRMVVYPTDTEYVMVVDEATGDALPSHRDTLLNRSLESGDSSMFAPRAHDYTANRYFDAHPEPKPWHDAKPGEVWVLSTGVEGEDHAWTVDPDFGTARFVYVGGLSNLPVDHPDITDGRRIWPEVE